jgi:hypothetical protein
MNQQLTAIILICYYLLPTASRRTSNAVRIALAGNLSGLLVGTKLGTANNHQKGAGHDRNNSRPNEAGSRASSE